MTESANAVDPSLLADSDAFHRLVVEPCRPVVLRGAVSHWPLARAAAEGGASLADYLAGFDVGRQVEAFVGAAGIGGRYTYTDDLAGFNFRRESMPLGEAIRRITQAEGDGDTLYVGSLPMPVVLPGLGEANRLNFMAPAMAPRIWIGHASTVACHYDMMDNLACAVAGRRRFTLYPPDAIGDLYVGPIDHSMAGQPVALAAEAEPGDPRYPRFDQARDRAITIDLEPGDALYMPKLWWHRVEARGAFNLLVNYWWDAFPVAPDQPFPTMLLAMSAIAGRPPEERAAWRAWFDHYVFRPDGHPLAHLPEARQGVLGDGPENAKMLRAHAMRMLRGG